MLAFHCDYKSPKNWELSEQLETYCDLLDTLAVPRANWFIIVAPHWGEENLGGNVRLKVGGSVLTPLTV